MNTSALLSDSISLLGLLVKDIEAAVVQGGGLGQEALQIAETLWADADFKNKVVAIIADIKG